jgi:hypothetical protein
MRELTMPYLEEAVAKELHHIVKDEVGVLREQIVALEAENAELRGRIIALEAANNLRGTLDQLGQRLDRIERANKAGIVRLGAA